MEEIPQIKLESQPPNLQSITDVQEQQILSATARMQPPSKSIAAPKYKKAPDAPKRFKSAFIIFSAEKHKEIKENLAKQGRSEKTTDIAKLVSEAWRELTPDQKEIWEKKARKDKARYEVEKAMYKGPWKVPANKRTPKDPTAPKRPMSAFLAFSNKRRAALKRQHPDATNADLSKMLSKTWKEAPQELRQKYMDEEAELRQAYKVEMAKWRKKVAEEKKAERKEREAMAMQTAENRANEAARQQATQASMDQVMTQQDMSGQLSGGMYANYGFPQQSQVPMGDMNFAMPSQQAQNPQNQQGQFSNMMGNFGQQGGLMNPQIGAATQQQLLQQLLAGQPMNQLMPGRNMGMYGQGMTNQNMSGQFGAQQNGMSGQFGPPGMGSQGMGSAGGNFGMDNSNMQNQRGGLMDGLSASNSVGAAATAQSMHGAAANALPAFDPGFAQAFSQRPPGLATGASGVDGPTGPPDDPYGRGTAI